MEKSWKNDDISWNGKYGKCSENMEIFVVLWNEKKIFMKEKNSVKMVE